MWRGVAGATVAGTLACLGSTASYGASFAYMQRFFAGRSGSASALSAAQLVCASVELAVVAPARARRLPHWPGAPAAVALLALGALGTGVAFVLNLGVVRPRDRPSPRRSPTSRCGRRPSGPCCWPNRWAGTRLSGVVVVGVVITRLPDRA